MNSFLIFFWTAKGSALYAAGFLTVSACCIRVGAAACSSAVSKLARNPGLGAGRMANGLSGSREQERAVGRREHHEQREEGRKRVLFCFPASLSPRLSLEVQCANETRRLRWVNSCRGVGGEKQVVEGRWGYSSRGGGGFRAAGGLGCCGEGVMKLLSKDKGIWLSS